MGTSHWSALFRWARETQQSTDVVLFFVRWEGLESCLSPSFFFKDPCFLLSLSQQASGRHLPSPDPVPCPNSLLRSPLPATRNCSVSFHRGKKAGYGQRIRNRNGLRFPSIHTGTRTSEAMPSKSRRMLISKLFLCPARYQGKGKQRHWSQKIYPPAGAFPRSAGGRMAPPD